MLKEEFIKDLDQALMGEVSEAKRQESVSYYRNYIDTEIARGKSEEQVLALLGSGRIIAKTVIEANYGEANEQRDTASYSYQNSAANDMGKVPFKTKAKVIGVIALILIVLVAIVGVVIHVVWVLLPVILVVWLIYYLVKRFLN